MLVLVFFLVFFRLSITTSICNWLLVRLLNTIANGVLLVLITFIAKVEGNAATPTTRYNCTTSARTRLYTFYICLLTLMRGTVKLSGSIVVFVSLYALENSTLATSQWFLVRKLSP